MRFQDSNTFQRESGVPGLVSEDSSHTASRAFEDSSEIQVKYFTRNFRVTWI